MTSVPHLRINGYTIADELFTRGFPARESPHGCQSRCCRKGVWLDVRDRDRILAHREVIAEHMDETQVADPARWFEPGEHDDPDFPSGRCAGTAVLDGRCAFLDRRGWCSIQVAAAAEGLHRWAWKPFYCVLFPLTVSRGVIGFDDMLQGVEACCTVAHPWQVPLFRACRDELIHALGEDGYQALDEAWHRSV